jgi:hypothetical protein
VRTMLLLVAGAVFNVAVAWGCAAYSGTRHCLQPRARGGAVSIEDLFRAFEPEIVDAQHYCGVDRTTTALAQYGGECGMPSWHQIDSIETRAGWPCRSLFGTQRPASYDDLVASKAENGVVISWRLIECDYAIPALVPTGPLRNGFAINTAFYAAILWLLFFAPLALGRRRRIKRGLCPACAYPVGSSDVCTECGTPVIRKAPKVMM